jgi:hypothetical protein
MATCQVEYTAPDGALHMIEITDATSVYDAADKAIQSWARLWWFHYDRDLVVKHPNKGTFKVKQETVRKWSEERRRMR